MGALHERLRTLGYDVDPSHLDFDGSTLAVVEAFQRSRGLPLTGVVDATTWERLDEARWQLGDRLLFFSSHPQRGDDVAELQVRLAKLGFDPGRIDGIFGPLLYDALREFQRNRDLDASGALTKATLQELSRVRGAHEPSSLVTDARDLAGFTVTTGAVVISGVGPLYDELAAALTNRREVHLLADGPHEETAAFANHHDVALVLSVRPLDGVDGVHLHYWASYRSHSRRGELIASSLASRVARFADGPRVEVTGMALPILRETKMTTVHLEHGNLSQQGRHQLVTVTEGLVDEVIHRTETKYPSESQ